jgi:hypothetical protein
MITRFRRLPWNQLLAGFALGESIVLVAIYVWYTFFR